MRGSRKFCQRSNSDNRFVFVIFVSGEGREDPNTTYSGPSSARQRNAIYMAFRWRADNGPTLNAGLILQGICTSIAKKPYSFVSFQGGPDPLSPSSLSSLVAVSVNSKGSHEPALLHVFVRTFADCRQ